MENKLDKVLSNTELNNMSERVIALRKRYDWTQEQLAEEINVSTSTIQRIERFSDPKKRTVVSNDLVVWIKLSKLFGVSLDYLIYGNTKNE